MIKHLRPREDFSHLLASAIAQALEQGEAYAVLALVPQRLPDEDVGSVVQVAAECVDKLVRDDDLAGYLEGETIAVGLRHGDRTAAQVFAHRLRGDLGLRSFHLRSTIWETGSAVLPDDGTTADELIDVAIDAARNRRRAMANRVPDYVVTIPPALGVYGKL
jgi:hypothetical protein